MSRMTPLVREFLQHGRSLACPVIDLHTHPDRFRGIYFPDPSVEGILRGMDRCGVARIAGAPHAGLVDPHAGNAVILALLQAHPDRFLGYWAYSPKYPELLEEAQAAPFEHPGVIGYKIHPAWVGLSLKDDAYQPLFAWANAHRLILLSHTWRGEHYGADACRWVAERYPEMRFILGHSLYDDHDGALALAADFPHVYLDLCAAERLPGFIDRAVRQGLTPKILFGTDFPWFDPHYGIGCVLFADIEDEDRHAILHGNAERLLKEKMTGK
ncbi:MAG: amidohydrolase family protein [Armatimonadota bacterium]